MIKKRKVAGMLDERCISSAADKFMIKLMRSINIQFGSVCAVGNFVKEISEMEGQFELISDRYIVDAKSLLSIFYLDLTKPMLLNINTDKAVNLERLKKYEIS